MVASKRVAEQGSKVLLSGCYTSYVDKTYEMLLMYCLGTRGRHRAYR